LWQRHWNCFMIWQADTVARNYSRLWKRCDSLFVIIQKTTFLSFSGTCTEQRATRGIELSSMRPCDLDKTTPLFWHWRKARSHLWSVYGTSLDSTYAAKYLVGDGFEKRELSRRPTSASSATSCVALLPVCTIAEQIADFLTFRIHITSLSCPRLWIFGAISRM
jgi:hypothetical protein